MSDPLPSPHSAPEASENPSAPARGSDTPAGAPSSSPGSAPSGGTEEEFSALLELAQAPLLPPRQPLLARVAALLGSNHLGLLVLCWLLLWAILALPAPHPGVHFQRGAIAPETVVAPYAVILLDRAETQSRRREAAALVPPEYDSNPRALDQALTELHTLMASARRSAAAAPEPVRRHMPPGSSAANSMSPQRRALLGRIARVPFERWNSLERVAREAVRAVYLNNQIRSDVEDDLVLARARIERTVQAQRSRWGLDAGEAALAADLARQVARRPNLLVDEQETQRARQKAQNDVRAVYQHLQPGTPLVKAGEIITDEQWRELQELDIVAPRFDSRLALARLALAALLVVFLASYLNRFHPELRRSPNSVWLVAMVPLVFLLLFRFLLRVPHASLTMMPMAATAAMLLAVLVNARVGLIAGFMVTGVCALMARTDAAHLLVTALATAIGVLAVAEITSRVQLLKTAALLGVTNTVLTAVLGIMREAPLPELVSTAVWGGSMGIVAVVAMYGLTMLLEGPFGITTHLRLLELLAPDEAVIRRMQIEAPGTYTHSLMVATLSEAAAKAIGADPLLARVGGLYHDIGKLRRPHCFVENQTGDNIHDRLSPQLSAVVILAHVRDGLELARALRLPQPVQDIIAQHHGTGIVTYFYHKAVHATSAPVDEESFRYAGPRPQSREAALVLLADSIEASARALPDPTPERLGEHIRDMIAQRLQEGELGECELTVKDLRTIESSFTHVLRAVMHLRIDYPEPDTALGTEAEDDAAQWMHPALENPLHPLPAQQHAPRSAPRRRREGGRLLRPRMSREGKSSASANSIEANGEKAPAPAATAAPATVPAATSRPDDPAHAPSTPASRPPHSGLHHLDRGSHPPVQPATPPEQRPQRAEGNDVAGAAERRQPAHVD